MTTLVCRRRLQSDHSVEKIYVAGIPTTWQRDALHPIQSASCDELVLLLYNVALYCMSSSHQRVSAVWSASVQTTQLSWHLICHTHAATRTKWLTTPAPARNSVPVLPPLWGWDSPLSYCTDRCSSATDKGNLKHMANINADPEQRRSPN